MPIAQRVPIWRQVVFVHEAAAGIGWRALRGQTLPRRCGRGRGSRLRRLGWARLGRCRLWFWQPRGIGLRGWDEFHNVFSQPHIERLRGRLGVGASAVVGQEVPLVARCEVEAGIKRQISTSMGYLCQSYAFEEVVRTVTHRILRFPGCRGSDRAGQVGSDFATRWRSAAGALTGTSRMQHRII